VHEHDVAATWAWGLEDDAKRFGGRDGRGEGDEDEGLKQPSVWSGRHSGRCWRRNCSISATSSDAGGRSL
jgi:hypothetical protein